ncbi:hypothetical protein [Enterobacter asburiae]|uniref:hypothetical protein n=1 Tax=Enterobacter asburiae TaxID=61645 RepID=UPI0034E8BF3A
MKKLTLVCALMGASATAVAADFSDGKTVTADIELKRPATEITFDVVATPDLTTIQSQNENTVLATAKAETKTSPLSPAGPALDATAGASGHRFGHDHRDHRG